jgi:hypothetical protein
MQLLYLKNRRRTSLVFFRQLHINQTVEVLMSDSWSQIVEVLLFGLVCFRYSCIHRDYKKRAGIAGKVQANERNKLKLANKGKFELYPDVKPRKAIFYLILQFKYSPSRFCQLFQEFPLYTCIVENDKNLDVPKPWKKHRSSTSKKKLNLY